MAIREDFLQTLKERIDIEDLVREYVDIKKAGSNSKGLCPFHSEKTPSFTVFPDTGSYFCFGCSNGGDIITFIREIENLDYVEAVKFLAEKAGLNMPEDNYDDTLGKKRQKMYKINKDAARFFYDHMMSPEGKAGLDYWLSRGFSMNTIRRFGLGFAPNNSYALINHMRQKGYSEQELFEVNLAKKNEKGIYYDNFRNRIMTPIFDLRGNVIAFGGRVLDDSKPKYINTSDTLIYKKTQNLFALNFAKSSGKTSLILCEGYMDVIALHQAGFTNAVAGCGTALTDEQVRLISRYADKVYLAYDGDGPGKEALEKAIAKFQQTDIMINPLVLEGGNDPDDILRKFGPERFKAILEGASNEIEYKLKTAKEGFDLTSDDGRIKYLRAAVAVLATLDNAIERDVYASRLSEELNVSKEAVLIQIKDAEKGLKRQKKKIDFKQLNAGFKNYKDDSTSRASTTDVQLGKAEEIILSSIFANPDFLKKIEQDLLPEDFKSDFRKRLYTVLQNRINAGQEIDLIYLSSEFTPEEMGQIVKLQNSGSQIAGTFKEIKDCIDVLKTERQKNTEISPAELSDEEFLKLFKTD
ncbi:MAG: DNA primase [Ruminococcaceae bacterium]|nr:DNA primase [Oscillospiraceae bacterium]